MRRNHLRDWLEEGDNIKAKYQEFDMLQLTNSYCAQ